MKVIEIGKQGLFLLWCFFFFSLLFRTSNKNDGHVMKELKNHRHHHLLLVV
jgi:hypothetical protein